MSEHIRPWTQWPVTHYRRIVLNIGQLLFLTIRNDLTTTNCQHYKPPSMPSSVCTEMSWCYNLPAGTTKHAYQYVYGGEFGTTSFQVYPPVRVRSSAGATKLPECPPHVCREISWHYQATKHGRRGVYGDLQALPIYQECPPVCVRRCPRSCPLLLQATEHKWHWNVLSRVRRFRAGRTCAALPCRSLSRPLT